MDYRQRANLDNPTVALVKNGEEVDKVYKQFAVDLDRQAGTWAEGEREECTACLWNKLFCAAVQFEHAELSETLITQPEFKKWVKSYSQTSSLHGPCPLTTSVHYENLELAKRLVDMGMDVHKEAPMMYLVPVPAGGAFPRGEGEEGVPQGEVCYVYEETRCCTAMDPTPLGRGNDSLHPPLLSENTWASIS